MPEQPPIKLPRTTVRFEFPNGEVIEKSFDLIPEFDQSDARNLLEQASDGLDGYLHIPGEG